MGSRVLVTGGAGFIGSQVVRALIARGDSPVVIDDLSAGQPGTLPQDVELIRLDISDPATVAAVDRLRPEVIIHAAAQISVAGSMQDPDHDRRVNVIGTQNVLEGAVRGDVRRVVYLSSGGAIYGDTGGARETDPPNPASYYGIHKWVAERYVALCPTPSATARLANVYGVGQRADQEGGVVAIFARRLREGSPATIFGDGRQCRDFVHVEDVADAIVTLAFADRVGVYNVGTGIATTINDLLATMEAQAHVSVDRHYEPRRAGDVRSSVLNIDAIREQLGWRPAVDLEHGLASVVHDSA